MFDFNLLRNKLINCNLCIQNNYLEKYLDIVINNSFKLPIKFKTEKHHIIPRFYFKQMNQSIDNSEDNICNLNYADHIRAHVYLALCVTEVFRRQASFAAGRTITGREGLYKNLDEAVEILDFETLGKFKEIYMHERGIISSRQKNNLNKCWIYNIELNKCKLINKEVLNTYLNNGWAVGRNWSPTIESKQKNSVAHKKIWASGATYTAEVLQKRILNRQQAIESGKLNPHKSMSEETKSKLSKASLNYFKNNSQINKGKICVHDNSTNKYIDKAELDNYLAIGYQLGSLQKPTNKKLVICLNTLVIYESASFVNRMLGTKSVGMACKNFRLKRSCNTIKGLKWAFLDDWLQLTDSEQALILDNIRKINTKE